MVGWSTRGDILSSSCYSKTSLEMMKIWGANSVRLAVDVNINATEEEKERSISAVKRIFGLDECFGYVLRGRLEFYSIGHSSNLVR